MKVCVIGSGNGGLAIAFDYAIHGHDVFLTDFEEFSQNIKDLNQEGGLTSEGELEGKVNLAYAGTDIGHAITGADLIIACGPAYSTARMAEAAKPYLTPGQPVLVSPSSCAGAIVFKQVLGVSLQDPSYPVAETSTLPYAVRVVGPAKIHVYLKLKGGLRMAALPASSIGIFESLVSPVYHAMESVTNIWQSSLGNANPVIHPAVTLVNAARIEQTGGDLFFYEDGVTDVAGNLIKALDEERIAIGEALGVTVEPDPVVGVSQGYMTEANYTTGYREAPGFLGIRAQSSLENRYFTEDVGYGLVFLTSLARMLEVEVPVMNSVITIVSVLMGRDFRKEAARTVESLDFLTKDALLKLES